jgi:hypothetical protein
LRIGCEITAPGRGACAWKESVGLCSRNILVIIAFRELLSTFSTLE